MGRHNVAEMMPTFKGRRYNATMAQNPSSQALAEKIVRTLQLAGHVAYFAGGCVRDGLMGREPKDYDVATAARPEQVVRIFPKAQQVGIAFGVVLVREKKFTVEVATFRTDGKYIDGRHPEAVTFATAQEDAQRRDFTCNGIFYDPVAGEYHDYVAGRADIAARVLRAIGEPHLRFGEDHLRLLRAVRFAAKLGFSIDPTTQAAMAELGGKIADISRERIGEEIRMIMEHSTRTRAIDVLAGFPPLFEAVFGVRATAMPPGPQDARWPRLAQLRGTVSRVLALQALLRDLWHDQASVDWTRTGEILRQDLMLSNQEWEEFAWLAAKWPILEAWRSASKAAMKRIMADPRWNDLAALFPADPTHAAELPDFLAQVAALQAEGVAPTPLISGADLIALGASPGPAFKRWLETLYDRQLDGELTTHAAALAAAREMSGQRQK